MKKKHTLLIGLLGFGLNNTNAQFVEKTKLENIFWGEVNFVDFNDDSAPDIILQGEDVDSKSHTVLYKGDKSGNFTIYTPASPLQASGKGLSAWGDYDNDGDMDLFSAGDKGTGGNFSAIYRNDGSPDQTNFIDINDVIPDIYHPTGADWGDFDNDGDLDIFITGIAASGGPFSKLFENLGNDKFVQNTQSTFEELSSWIDACAFVDYDNDGDLDISYVGMEDGGGADKTRTHKLYQNNDGIFTDVSFSIPFGGRGSVDWADFDNDGDLDLLISGAASATALYLSIYRNDENNFTYAGQIGAGATFGNAKWVDYDNDGDLDIFYSAFSSFDGYPFSPTHSGFYKNDMSANDSSALTLDQTATNSVKSLGAGSFDFFDYDKDRDLDLVISGHEGSESTISAYVYENTSAAKNTRPTAPSNLSESVDKDKVVFTWDRGSDAETHANALCYNLIIGTTSYGFDVMSSYNKVGGICMKIAKRGNVGNSLTWNIKNLPNGTYYWSVSTVDHGYLVSTQSNERTFTITDGKVSINHINTNPLIQLYPNPAQNQITISSGELINRVEITNHLGQKIQVNKEVVDLNKHVLNIDKLSSGVYFAHTYTNKGKQVLKFIKN